MIMSSTRVFQSWPAPWGFLHCSMNPNINTLPCCLLLICEQDSSAVQYKQIYKTQLPSQAAFWAPALAGVITVLQRPRTQPSLDLLVFLLIPLYKEPSPAVLCGAGSRCKHVRPRSSSLAFSLNVSGPDQDENFTLFSPKICLILKYMGRSL